MRASARRHASIAAARSSTGTGSDGPGVELERLLAPGGQRRVENVERMERLHALHEEVLGEPVQRAGGEAARVDVAPLADERLQLLVDGHVARERLVAHLREPA